MNERLYANPQDIISLILKDHAPLKRLINNLKDTHFERSKKEAWLEKFITTLTGPAKSEEQSQYIFKNEYDALKLESYPVDTKFAIAEQLIYEVNRTFNEDEWMAKVNVLAEMVTKHIEEEETEILDMVRQEIELAERITIGDEYIKLSQDYNHLDIEHPYLYENNKDIFKNDSLLNM